MNGPAADAQIDKRWVGRSFAAAAAHYDGVAGLQRAVGAQLLSRLPADASPAWALDVGTGTGWCAAALVQRYPAARVLALDIAEPMLRAARQRVGVAPGRHYLGGDAEALPLADGSVDLVVSNLAVQWCADLAQAFREFRRVLKPGGLVLLSTFGPGTLVELRRAWAVVDGYSHVNSFADAAAVAGTFREAGFSGAEVESETRRLVYPDVHGLMRELKGLGAHNVTAGRPRHLMGKRRLQRMIAAYPAQEQGEVRASFEMMYGRAWK
jgi:malonyl-CoA O-methyltransferase